MARLEDAVRVAPEGVALDLEVQPGAKADGFPSGFNPWRGRIQARVQAPAEDGEANEALRGLVSTFFDLPPSRVVLSAGHTHRQKTVLVQGLPWKDALARLTAGLRAQR